MLMGNGGRSEREREREGGREGGRKIEGESEKERGNEEGVKFNTDGKWGEGVRERLVEGKQKKFH